MEVIRLDKRKAAPLGVMHGDRTLTRAGNAHEDDVRMRHGRT